MDNKITHNEDIDNIIIKSIEKIRELCTEIKPLLAIQCITFNQEKYIRETLDGFVLQNTNFPIVAIIHDDASTDKTASIVKEYAKKYPNLILPIFEEINQYSKRDGSLDKILHKALSATGAKYIAYCEGDDYWTDPLKLKKQVAFLESNPEYGLSYTNCIKYIQSKNKYKPLTSYKIDSIDQLIENNPICTLTVVIRYNLLKSFRESNILDGIERPMMGDYQIWLWASMNSKLHFLNDTTAIYRILPNSASHGNLKHYIKFKISEFLIKIIFANKSNINSNIYLSKFYIYNVILNTLTNNHQSRKVFQTKLIVPRQFSFFKIKILLSKKAPILILAYLYFVYRGERNQSFYFSILKKLYKLIS